MKFELLGSVMILLLILDPFGNIPLFITGLKSTDPKRKTFIILRESIIAYALLLLFMFFGKAFLSMFIFNTISLGIAGGIILFLIAVKMVF